MTKDEARAIAYRQLHEAKATRFPFPVEGRIPNFKGAEDAARRLAALDVYKKARGIKVNPDAPQLPVRAMALQDGKTVYMPSPRLKGSFLQIRPEDVPAGEARRAASLTHCRKYGHQLTLEQLRAAVKGDAPIDLVVAGSVAVTHDGARAGKGEGYADMEYAFLRQLGMDEVPVVTTVHDAQIVPTLTTADHDLALDYVVTADAVIETNTSLPKPHALLWHLLTDDDMAAMPILAELRQQTWETMTVRDIIQPHLPVLFVGINPGQRSAADGRHFAGPGNHFWRLLHDSGLTPNILTPQEDETLLQHGIGITNAVSRSSRGEADLAWDELVEGGRQLQSKIARFQPKVVALLGKNVYRAYAGLRPSADVQWGEQKQPVVAGTIDFVAPNPSARSTVPYADRLALYAAIRRLAPSAD